MTKAVPRCLFCSRTLKKSKAPRKKSFCHDRCRWRYHNKLREEALKEIRAQRASDCSMPTHA